MRTTSSFEVFPNEPSERELSRARWYRREGRLDDAEAAYREVIEKQPSLRTAWTECFELLRAAGRSDRALELASAARQTFHTEAFPLTLEGAARIELGQFEQALRALEAAVDRDPDLALTWHELGNAAYKLGDANRAMLALDRAFALEPHTETLILRGRILRDAGESYAAEVAFEAALHSAEHEDQEVTIRHEIAVTRRQGAFTPRWVQELSPAQEWFSEFGTVVIAGDDGATPPNADELIDGLVGLIHDSSWRFGQLVGDPTDPAGALLAERLGVTCDPLARIDLDKNPLLVATRPTYQPEWMDAVRAVSAAPMGLVFALWHPIESEPAVHIVGGLERDGRPIAASVDPSTAVVMAQHPAARVAGRRLGTSPTAAGAP